MNNTSMPVQQDSVSQLITDGTQILHVVIPTFSLFLPCKSHSHCKPCFLLRCTRPGLGLVCPTQKRASQGPVELNKVLYPRTPSALCPLVFPQPRLPSRHTFSWLRFRKVLLQAERWKLQGCVCMDTIKHTQTQCRVIQSESYRVQLLYRTGLTLWILSFLNPWYS